VIREMRDRILVGRLPGGSRVDLDSLAKEFGTSRTPVREACLELAHDGLLNVAPRSGVTVVGVSSEDTEDNFAIMAVLSGMAAGLAASRITDEEVEEVERLRDDVAAAASQDSSNIAAANWAFHRRINLACRSPRLHRLLRQTGMMIPLSYFDLFPEQIPCSLSEHDALVQALRSHDAVLARSITEQHFFQSGEVVAGHLEGRADVGEVP
jgi:DNA-binding GntR family transcriptional regulator